MLAALAVAVGLTACGGTSTSATGDPGTIAIGLSVEPENLDFSTTDGTGIPEAMLVNVYEGLVKLDPQGRIVPLLARRWRVSEDRRTYVFDLRSGVRFSNGSPFDADAVKFSIERVKSPAWKVALKSGMDVVRRVRVLSPTRVAVDLKEPSNAWLFAMTTRIGAMYTPDGVDALPTKPVGTGPYVLDRRVRGDSIVLRRNPAYWGRRPAMERVAFKYFKDATALNNALLSGAIDVIADHQAPDSLAQFTDDDRFRVTEGTTNGELTMALNNARGPMKDPRIRHAVSLGIDRKAVMDAAWSGRGTLIGSMVPPTDPWFEHLEGLHRYDPARAKALLAQAGVRDLKLRFRIPNLPYVLAPAQVVQSQLRKIGVTADIEILEYPARWLSEVFTKQDYDLSIVRHTEPRDIATFGNPDYYWGYDDPQVQAWLARADRGTTREQVADMRRVARKLATDDAAIWLYLMPSLVVADADVRGLPRNRVSEALDVTTIRR
ncbi:ABC transporter substrate-binding protein [Patulibacter sp. SYSU D01012]|uniref:ABC transporter substrate-binding protein n=1 Tax=Patulibacter sp. SYSU D01012 TaxID=2817381 RepID=UPI0032C0E2DB